MVMYKQEFKVGERVKIARPWVCRWGCTDTMRKMVGMEATIRRAKWMDGTGVWEYLIYGDKFCFSWSADCFDRVNESDLQDFIPETPESLMQLFL